MKSRRSFRSSNRVLFMAMAATVSAVLTGCGGSSSPAKSTFVPPVVPPSPPSTVSLTGKITFDSIPHNSATSGLNYSAITQKPARGVTVELLDSAGAVLSTTKADDDGKYAFTVNSNKDVRVRAKAEIVQTAPAIWDMKVTDNTSANALYTLQGSLASSGAANSVRDLNAPSGWGGSSYTSTRAAAPFAILDPIYSAVKKFEAIDPDINFPALEFRWSTSNIPQGGDVTRGEIGTSSYQRSAGAPNGYVYILGDANNDTDEYDSHIIVHEWGHYFEDRMSRSDSVGGPHSGGDVLDPRVALGEGFGNALSGMILDDPIYRDSGGSQQASGFSINVENNTHAKSGWFNEGSVQSILYDLYDSTDDGSDTLSLGLGPLYRVFTAASYKASPVFTTIFSFTDELKTQNAGEVSAITSLLVGQSIDGTTALGSGETNDGGISASLPVYKSASVNGGAVQVCSVDDAGQYNKLGNRQYITFEVATAGLHTLTMSRTSGATNRDPDFTVFKEGTLVANANSAAVDTETASVNLQAGQHVIDANEYNNIDPNSSANSGDACFDFTITQ